MLYGYTGKILHVDLSTEQITIEEPSEKFYRTYIGGSAMGLYYILKDQKPGCDAFDPANILTLMLSAATGMPISGQSRMTANAKSPLADGIGDAECGGFFPAELKFAGFDGIVIRGRAAHPVYLWVHDGKAELRDASALWGKTTSQATQMLEEELGDRKIQIAQCGPAGEKLVRMAAIINMNNRANGRTGMGAVMGSKNLKAVVVRGSSKRLKTFNPQKVNELAKEGTGNVQFVPGLQKYGTAEIVAPQHFSGGLPTRNFNEGQFEGYSAISGETMVDTILKETDTCYACSVRCKRVVESEWMGHAIQPESGGPEYETISTLGSYCGVSDLKAVAYANQLCNEYGLDTISSGATVAWAMECFEKGLFTEEEIGRPLPFGDAAGMVSMIEQIALRLGFGDVLAEGTARAAKRLGKGEDYLITSKGTETPAHMPQVKRSLGLIYAVNPFGADHQSSEHDPMVEEGASASALAHLGQLGIKPNQKIYSLDRDKVDFAYKTQVYYSFLDTANLCQIIWGPATDVFTPEGAVALVQAVTGWEDFSIEEMMLVGERRINLMKVFNQREGIDRKSDQLPKKFFKPLQGSGPSVGFTMDKEEFEKALAWYYEMANWDQNGNPTQAQLIRLGIDWARPEKEM